MTSNQKKKLNISRLFNILLGTLAGAFGALVFFEATFYGDDVTHRSLNTLHYLVMILGAIFGAFSGDLAYKVKNN